MRSSVFAVVVLLTATWLGACGGAYGGHFREDAYYPSRDHYRVRRSMGSSAPGGLLSEHWLLDNFRVEDGEPRDPKSGPDYRTTYSLDRDGDGRADRPVRAELYDLRFVHAHDGSVLWSRTMPVDRIAERRELEVIAHDYVDRVGGGNYFNVTLSGEVEQRRLGTRIVEEGPVRVGGAEGWMVTFDVLALDQQEANPQYTGNRVTMVLVRPEGALWSPQGEPRPDEGWPMLVVLGLAGRAELQPTHTGDFLDFLSRLDMHPGPR